MAVSAQPRVLSLYKANEPAISAYDNSWQINQSEAWWRGIGWYTVAYKDEPWRALRPSKMGAQWEAWNTDIRIKLAFASSTNPLAKFGFIIHPSINDDDAQIWPIFQPLNF
jgi:hypothetical protein